MGMRRLASPRLLLLLAAATRVGATCDETDYSYTETTPVDEYGGAFERQITSAMCPNHGVPRPPPSPRPAPSLQAARPHASSPAQAGTA